MKKFFSILMAIALVLVLLPVSGAQAQKPVDFESSIQIRNLSPNDGGIAISFFSIDGTMVGEATDTIAGNTSKTYYQSTMPVVSGFNGSVVVASNVPTAGISNLVGLASNRSRISYGGFSAFNAGSEKVYLPLLMKRNYSYDTFFYVQNLGNANADVTITYSDGETAQLNGIRPGAAKAVYQDTENHPTEVFSAILTADQPVAVTVAQNGNTLSVYNGFSAGAKFPVMPLIQANYYNYFTGVQIQNVGSMPTEVKVEYDPDPSFGIGSTSCYEIQTIQPGQSNTFVQYALTYERPPEHPDIYTTCVKGTPLVGSGKVTVNTSNQPLVAVVNQLNNKNDQKGNTYSALNPEAGGQTIVYPLVLDRYYSNFTSWSIVNVGYNKIPAGDIVCTITGQAEGGPITPMVVTNPEDIPVGKGWSYQHLNQISNKFVGGATCIANGHSVVGTTNQLQLGKRGIDTFMATEGFVLP